MVDRTAASDRENPGKQASAARVIELGSLPDLEEHDLLHVLGGRAIAERPDQQPERRAPVAVVRLAQRIRIAAPQALGEPSLLPFHASSIAVTTRRRRTRVR